MAKLTEEEARAREEARAAKRRAQLEKHAVPCPHCQKSVLDHMTRCPYCGGALVPKGYAPMDEEKKRKVRNVCYIAGFAIAIVIVVLILVLR